jgi:hypothetical protein
MIKNWFIIVKSPDGTVERQENIYNAIYILLHDKIFIAEL